MTTAFSALPAESKGLPFSTSDLVQLACEGQYGLELAVTTSLGNGLIRIWQGVVWSAEDAGGEGSVAFRRVVQASLRDEGARVRVREIDAPGRRTVSENWRALLLDAACACDEEREAASNRPPLTPVPELNPASGLETPAHQPLGFAALVELGVGAILERRFREALKLFVAAEELQPEDRLVTANVQRLRDLIGADSPERPDEPSFDIDVDADGRPKRNRCSRVRSPFRIPC